ncbi:hypothetical protein TNCV_1658211 [Trichonephila clavipes]|nr:hypothetical protein TNCV_1658211 [Trichonephila clavipes]
MREKSGNRLVTGPNFMVDASTLSNQAPKGLGESLQKFVAWCYSDGTQHLFCWSILTISVQSLTSNGPVVDSRELNLVFGHVEAVPNKGFLSSPIKHTVEPSWTLSWFDRRLSYFTAL